MITNQRLTRFYLLILLIISASCSYLKDNSSSKREIASMNSLGILGPDGKVLLYYKDSDFIIVKSCEPNTVLGTTPDEARDKCQGKVNRIPLPYFHMALRNVVSTLGPADLKPLTPNEVKAFKTFSLNEAQLETMKKEVERITNEVERMNDFIKEYGKENADLRKREELLSTLKTYRDYLNALKKIDAEIEKGISFLTNQETLSLKKPSSNKGEFLYSVLQKFDPEIKIPCGLIGTVDERIKDCSYQVDARKGKFVLVRRSKEFSEVYLNTRSHQLWSDVLSVHVTQFEASEVCKKDPPETRGLLSKGSGLMWRAPFIEEFEEAEYDGSKSALPNLNLWQWSQSFKGLQKKNRMGYLYSANGPRRYLYNQEIYNNVRCVTSSI